MDSVLNTIVGIFYIYPLPFSSTETTGTVTISLKYIVILQHEPHRSVLLDEACGY